MRKVLERYAAGCESFVLVVTRIAVVVVCSAVTLGAAGTPVVDAVKSGNVEAVPCLFLDHNFIGPKVVGYLTQW